MKVAVWGAGQIGLSLAYRLVTCEFVSDLTWINRTYSNISSRVADLDQGLAFAPCCRRVHGIDGGNLDYVRGELDDVDLVILTQGEGVPSGGTRASLLDKNKAIMSAAIEALQGFEGVILVVTNPVDALARYVCETSGVPSHRVIGLGTIVETARLRSAVAAHMLPDVPARAVWCFAIGTHDDQTVLVRGPTGVGLRKLPDGVWDSLRTEVVTAPHRVKADGRSTLHPVVEGVVTIARAISHDSGEVLTVSVEDDETGLYFSVPVSVGRAGVLDRHVSGLDPSDLATCRRAAATLQRPRAVGA